MDRLLVFTAQVAIAHGHRVEVTEQVDPLTEEPVVLTLVDLDTGIRYRRKEEPGGEVSRWIGRVLECTITLGGSGARTALLVDPIGPGATGAKVALRGADAAADAAKAEADRWGGADRPAPVEHERFW
ncbi:MULTISPECIES: hypothetical protein [unclassified Microbacterium]|uniref:hypothetical protein n=1 Tax=unclassified Microbacterium TaxID=2609290 RepID=UPI0016055B9B|nr:MULTISPECIES: hypothetical protein [unclassified Microbacterium]QNA92942.1 hypothetical protein G4G29_12330 [Microbacterium sp. Se63.02b]QYM63102.1 hypothetical protein K1X59_12380 [Microbacterium sp. Se5.02b]